MTELVLSEMRRLADTLTLLHGRVREAVAIEVAKAIADAVAEVVTTALGGQRMGYSRYGGHAGSHGRSDWDDPEPRDWNPHRRADRHDDVDDDPANWSPAPAAVLAIGVAASQWWLSGKGSPWTATGVGLAAALVLLAGGPLTRSALVVLLALQRLMVASGALGEGASFLGKI